MAQISAATRYLVDRLCEAFAFQIEDAIEAAGKLINTNDPLSKTVNSFVWMVQGKCRRMVITEAEIDEWTQRALIHATEPIEADPSDPSLFLDSNLVVSLCQTPTDLQPQVTSIISDAYQHYVSAVERAAQDFAIDEKALSADLLRELVSHILARCRHTTLDLFVIRRNATNVAAKANSKIEEDQESLNAVARKTSEGVDGPVAEQAAELETAEISTVASASPDMSQIAQTYMQADQHVFMDDGNDDQEPLPSLPEELVSGSHVEDSQPSTMTPPQPRKRKQRASDPKPTSDTVSSRPKRSCTKPKNRRATASSDTQTADDGELRYALPPASFDEALSEAMDLIDRYRPADRAAFISNLLSIHSVEAVTKQIVSNLHPGARSLLLDLLHNKPLTAACELLHHLPQQVESNQPGVVLYTFQWGTDLAQTTTAGNAEVANAVWVNATDVTAMDRYTLDQQSGAVRRIEGTGYGYNVPRYAELWRLPATWESDPFFQVVDEAAFPFKSADEVMLALVKLVRCIMIILCRSCRTDDGCMFKSLDTELRNGICASPLVRVPLNDHPGLIGSFQLSSKLQQPYPVSKMWYGQVSDPDLPAGEASGQDTCVASTSDAPPSPPLSDDGTPLATAATSSLHTNRSDLGAGRDLVRQPESSMIATPPPPSVPHATTDRAAASHPARVSGSSSSSSGPIEPDSILSQLETAEGWPTTLKIDTATSGLCFMLRMTEELHIRCLLPDPTDDMPNFEPGTEVHIRFRRSKKRSFVDDKTMCGLLILFMWRESEAVEHDGFSQQQYRFANDQKREAQRLADYLNERGYRCRKVPPLVRPAGECPPS